MLLISHSSVSTQIEEPQAGILHYRRYCNIAAISSRKPRLAARQSGHDIRTRPIGPHAQQVGKAHLENHDPPVRAALQAPHRGF